MLREAYTCDMCHRDIIVNDQSSKENYISTSPTIIKVQIPGKHEYGPGEYSIYGKEKTYTFCQRCTQHIIEFIHNGGHLWNM